MRNQGLGLLEGPWDSITSYKWAYNSSLGNLYKPRWGTISSIRSPGAMGFVVGGRKDRLQRKFKFSASLDTNCIIRITSA